MNLIVDIGNTRTKYAVFDRLLGLSVAWDYRKRMTGDKLFEKQQRGKSDFVKYGGDLGGSSGKVTGCVHFILRIIVGNSITDTIGI